MKNIIIFFFISILFFSFKKKDTLFLKNNIDELFIKIEKSSNTSFKIKKANEILTILKTRKLDSIAKNNYVSLIAVYYYENDLKFIKICEDLITDNSKTNINHSKGFSSYYLGFYYFNNSKYEKAFYYLSKAEKFLNNNNDLNYYAYAVNTKANILTFKKDFVEAEKLSIKALKIAKQKNDDLLIYNCLITLGNSLLGLNNYNKAIEYYNNAEKIVERLKSDPNYLSYKLQPSNYISTVYQNQKNYTKAYKTAKNALTLINNKNKEILLYCYLTNNLAYSKFKLRDKSSLNQFQETLKIGDSIKSIPIIITSKTYLGEYYLTEKDTLKANFYLKDAQLQAHKNNIYEDELKILQLLALANPVKESFYNNRYIQLNDSLQNVERSTRDKFARIEFETDEITTQKKLVEKENVILSDSIWLIFTIALLAILITYFIYKNLLLKAKRKEFLLIEEQKKAEEEIFQLMITQQNKFEEGKNTEKQRISLEIHDNVLAKLAAIKANIELQMLLSGLDNNEKFNKILDELENVQKEARNVAHDLHKNMFTNNSSFIEVVTELTTNINNYTAIHFTIEASPNVNWDNVNNTIKINLYRIIQEALHNIEKYAQANKVSIEIDQNENILTVNIIDDGKGFDSTTNKEGIGLKNMKTRMDSLNGLVKIISAVKKGTKINLTVPI